mgnify:CR=1 FL=1
MCLQWGRLQHCGQLVQVWSPRGGFTPRYRYQTQLFHRAWQLSEQQQSHQTTTPSLNRNINICLQEWQYMHQQHPTSKHLNQRHVTRICHCCCNRSCCGCASMHPHPRSQPSVTPKSNHTPQASDLTKSKAINSHALGNVLTLACTSAIQPEQPQHWANEQVNPQGDHGHLSLKASIKRSCNMSLYTLECMPALHMGVWPHMGCIPYNTVLKSTRSQQELGTTL